MDDADADEGVFSYESSYLECVIELGVAGSHILSVDFPDAPTATADAEHPLLDRVEAYLEGETEEFADVEIALSAATADHDILEALRDVPYGEEVNCEEVAQLAAMDPSDQAVLQRVREALAENPTPLLVPDHRVRDGPSAAPPAVEQRLRSLEGL